MASNGIFFSCISKLVLQNTSLIQAWFNLFSIYDPMCFAQTAVWVSQDEFIAYSLYHYYFLREKFTQTSFQLLSGILIKYCVWCQALIWDIQQMPRAIEDPILGYTAAKGGDQPDTVGGDTT